MDSRVRAATRAGDPVAVLRARVQRGDDWRGLPPCKHCGRDLGRLDVACQEIPCPTACRALRNRWGWWSIGDDGSGGRWVDCPGSRHREGTGRVEWPWADRLALAAYAGDEAARNLSPWAGWGPWQSDTLRGFLQGLDRWPGAGLWAAIGAGRAVHRHLFPGHEMLPESSQCLGCITRKAIQAATDFAHCGCEASLRAWVESGPRERWLPRSYCERTTAPPISYADNVQAAARETSPEVARAGASAALVSWALHGRISV